MTSARRDLDDSEVDWSQCTWLSYDTALSQYSLYLFRKCVIPHTSGAHCLQDQWPSFQTHPCLGTLRMCRWWPPHVMRYISPDKMRQHYQEIKLSLASTHSKYVVGRPCQGAARWSHVFTVVRAWDVSRLFTACHIHLLAHWHQQKIASPEFSVGCFRSHARFAAFPAACTSWPLFYWHFFFGPKNWHLFLERCIKLEKFILLVSELIRSYVYISMCSNVSDGVMSYTRNKFLPYIPR